MRVNAFIAVRMGSRRVPLKNFRMIGGKPLYEHLTETALQLKATDQIFLNSDSDIALEIAREKFGTQIGYHLRPSELGTSAASLDSYAYEFMVAHPADITVFLNPCSLLLTATTIDQAIAHVIKWNLDSCVSSKRGQTHVFFENQPINFSFDAAQPRSQDLVPVHLMTSGFFIWKNSSFTAAFEAMGHANFSGKFESFAVSDLEATDIDTEEDFLAAAHLIDGGARPKAPSYHPLIEKMHSRGELKPN